MKPEGVESWSNQVSPLPVLETASSVSQCGLQDLILSSEEGEGGNGHSGECAVVGLCLNPRTPALRAGITPVALLLLLSA